MKVAVVGAGIAGIYSAHRLAAFHDVTLYESGGSLGGHTDTHHIRTDAGTVSVDTGFIVFNEHNYPLFSAFLDELGVSSRQSDMSFSVSDRNSGLEYNAATLRGLICNRRNLLRSGFYRMMADILRFYRRSTELLHDTDDELTIGKYLERNGYSPDFIENHLIPMASALWSSPPGDILRFPARYFIAFMDNHRMLQVYGRPQWKTVVGGSSSYVRAFENRFTGLIRKNSTVIHVGRSPDGVRVSTDSDCVRYDAVVMACHSDQAARVLDEIHRDQRTALAGIPYQSNEVILHTDATVMPSSEGSWASWNVVRTGDSRDEYVVTYCMNLLQGIDSPCPLLVSLNAGRHLDPDRILLTRHYDHPIYTPDSLRARRQLAKLSGRDDIYFAGAYMGWGFHEDGARSARCAADLIDERMAVSNAA